MRAQRQRAGVLTIIGPSEGLVVLNATSFGFTCRLPTPCLAGDRVLIFSLMAASRPRAHTPNGAVRTTTLEDDAREAQAQLQEHRRDLNRALTSPLGERGIVLPLASERAGRMLAFDAAGGLNLVDAVQVLTTLGVFVDDGPWGEAENPLTHDDGPFA